MTFPYWVHELATGFWDSAGRNEPFPRELRWAIARALPVTVVLLPRLRVATVDDWLNQQRVLCRLDIADRALRGCLVAHHGNGVVFLDGADSADQQRFSLAHEVGHYLRDYWQPRRLASERCGPSVLEVFDGERPPRSSERIHALLSHVSIGFHVHLMDRNDGSTQRVIDDAEGDADILAFELLAPWETVAARIQCVPPRERAQTGTQMLVKEFGLPDMAAARYAAQFLGEHDGPASLVTRLRAVR